MNHRYWSAFASFALTLSICLANVSQSDEGAQIDHSPFPKPASIKGLQVQMVDDAIALGIHHAGINFAINGLYAKPDAPNGLDWSSEGKRYRFNRSYVEALDRQIKPLSDAGIVVYAILIAYPTGVAEIDQVVIHPDADADRKYTVGAFNNKTPEGREWLQAALEFLAHRYCRRDTEHGRVWGWIVGNEVNSHFMWYNRGPCSLDDLADGYERTVRIAHDAIRKFSDHARVYLSFDHYWTVSHLPGQPQKSVPGRSLLEAFAAVAKLRGDFEWHIAWHPYHSNLFATDLWGDQQAPEIADAPKVTFRNLSVLADRLEQPDMQWQGQPRRIILSEQGFHSDGSTEGARKQAAAFAYAWTQANRIPNIDAFIYHRHVDHAHEGGLNLGLWTKKPGTISNPGDKKPIYDLFLKAATDQWSQAADAYLPTAGLTAW
jgi:hypothetical protein